jgi:predicted nuclease of predicted toxin-antitoxin system
MEAPTGRGVSERLLLDEHFPAVIAARLREVGFDVQAVVEDSGLVGVEDPILYRVAQERGLRLVTENVKDFRPLMARALASGDQPAPLLLTTARRHPRH